MLTASQEKRTDGHRIFAQSGEGNARARSKSFHDESRKRVLDTPAKWLAYPGKTSAQNNHLGVEQVNDV